MTSPWRPKMRFRSQRRLQSRAQQNHGTPSFRNHHFRSASPSAVCCSLCFCVKASIFSIHSECAPELVSVLTNAIALSVRLYTWRASLFLLLSTIIVLVPASFCMVLAYRSGPSLYPHASSWRFIGSYRNAQSSQHQSLRFFAPHRALHLCPVIHPTSRGIYVVQSAHIDSCSVGGPRNHRPRASLGPGCRERGMGYICTQRVSRRLM